MGPIGLIGLMCDLRLSGGSLMSAGRDEFHAGHGFYQLDELMRRVLQFLREGAVGAVIDIGNQP